MFRILTTADILESLDRDWRYATSFVSFPAYFEIRRAVPTDFEGLMAGRSTRPVRTDSRFHIFGWVQAGLNSLRRPSTHAIRAAAYAGRVRSSRNPNTFVGEDLLFAPRFLYEPALVHYGPTDACAFPTHLEYPVLCSSPRESCLDSQRRVCELP